MNVFTFICSCRLNRSFVIVQRTYAHHVTNKEIRHGIITRRTGLIGVDSFMKVVLNGIAVLTLTSVQ